MEPPEQVTHITGPVYGLVYGNYNTVTLVFSGGEQRTVPFLAPPRPPHNLVGRDAFLHALEQRLVPGGSVALSGLPGVGKTALAVQLAHDPEVLERFQDGVLWAGLGRQPDTTALLGAWGASLSISAGELSGSVRVEDRARIIHAAIGMRRMLLVADDAWDATTALTFKLGGPHCAHLVTTRLPDVADVYAGADPTAVGELSEDEALTLFERLTPGVIETAPDEARALIRSTGGLPLAITLLAGSLRLPARSGQPRRLRAALERLRNVGERLQIEQPQGPLERHPSLPSGVPLSLLAIIRVSEEALAEGPQRVLWALSVFPAKPNSFSEDAAVAVSDDSVDALDSLNDRGLLESYGPGRYTLHQTIADYASAKRTDPSVETRLVNFFVAYAAAHPLDFALLDLDQRNIFTALEIAFRRDMKLELVRGVNAFAAFLENRLSYDAIVEQLQRAESFARQAGDTAGLIATLHSLGKIARYQGNSAQAAGHLQEALELARPSGDRGQLSAVLADAGWVAFDQGDLGQAQACWREGLALARAINDQQLISFTLHGLGAAAFNRGDYAAAYAQFQEALDLSRALGLADRTAGIDANLGWLELRQGHYTEAAAHFDEGLKLVRPTGNRERISFMLQGLGAVADKRGDTAQAETYWLEALALARAIGHRDRISALLANLAPPSFSRGDRAQTEAYWSEALALAREIGHRERMCDLLVTLGTVASERGDDVRAEAQLSEALSTARAIGHRLLTCDALNAQGELRLKQGQVTVASAAFEEALQLAAGEAMQEQAAGALFGLARCAAANGEIAKARQAGDRSLAIYEMMGHRNADGVKRWLAMLSPEAGRS